VDKVSEAKLSKRTV